MRPAGGRLGRSATADSARTRWHPSPARRSWPPAGDWSGRCAGDPGRVRAVPGSMCTRCSTSCAGRRRRSATPATTPGSRRRSCAMRGGRVSETALVPSDIAPGLVPTGFSEHVLARAREIDDPARLWDGATTLAALAQKWNGHGAEKREIKTAQMFAEILLGKLLGPRPGPGNQWLSHAISSEVDGLIPQPRISELQRLWRWTDALLEAVRNGTIAACGNGGRSDPAPTGLRATRPRTGSSSPPAPDPWAPGGADAGVARPAARPAWRPDPACRS